MSKKLIGLKGGDVSHTSSSFKEQEKIRQIQITVVAFSQ
jgi:hypothetical protein